MGNPKKMHLDPNELLEYFDGTLAEWRVREHLDTCQWCRSRLKDFFLMKILLVPPERDLPGRHVPPETFAEYLENVLAVEQNRAVEDHLAKCRRCLADYLALKRADKDEHEKTPSDALVREVLDNLEKYRTRKALGTVFVKKFREAVNLVFEPAPEPDDLGVNSEDAAAYLYSFRPEPERMMRLERETMMDDEPSAEAFAVPEQPAEYEVGELLQRQRITEPVTRSIPTDNNRVSVSVTKEDEHHTLVVEILDREGATFLPGIRVTLDPLTDSPVSRQTDQLGTARFVLPHGPSTLRLHLEKTYELNLQSLL